MTNKYLLTFAEVAVAIRFAPSTVKKWAYGQSKPPEGFPAVLPVGGRALYRRTNIEAWIAAISPRSPLPKQEVAVPRGRGRPRKMPRIEEGLE